MKALVIPVQQDPVVLEFGDDEGPGDAASFIYEGQCLTPLQAAMMTSVAAAVATTKCTSRNHATLTMVRTR